MTWSDLTIVFVLTVFYALMLVIYHFAEDKEKRYATEHDHYRIAYNKNKNLFYIQQLIYSNSEGAIWVTEYSTATVKRHDIEMIMDHIIKHNYNAVEDDDITI